METGGDGARQAHSSRNAAMCRSTERNKKVRKRVAVRLGKVPRTMLGTHACESGEESHMVGADDTGTTHGAERAQGPKES